MAFFAQKLEERIFETVKNSWKQQFCWLFPQVVQLCMRKLKSRQKLQTRDLRKWNFVHGKFCTLIGVDFSELEATAYTINEIWSTRVAHVDIMTQYHNALSHIDVLSRFLRAVPLWTELTHYANKAFQEMQDGLGKIVRKNFVQARDQCLSEVWKL